MKGGRILHHGTLMFDSDLSVVSEALKVSADKYKTKGFQSVRSRVTNIKPYAPADMDMETFKRILKENMTQKDVEVYRLTEEDLRSVRQIQAERYDTWEWNYGASPEYSVQKKRRIEGFGQIEVLMNVEKGKIKAFESYGDYFGEGAAESLKKQLLDCPLEKAALTKRLEEFNLERCYSHLDKKVFIELLLS